MAIKEIKGEWITTVTPAEGLYKYITSDNKADVDWGTAVGPGKGAVLTPEILKKAKDLLDPPPSPFSDPPGCGCTGCVEDEKVAALKAEKAAIVAEQAEEKEKEKVNVPFQLPDGKEWVKKWFPKGSKIIGPLRSVQTLKRRMAEDVSLFGSLGGLSSLSSITSWKNCIACLFGLSHTFPEDNLFDESTCRCGHLWSSHRSHNCDYCSLEKCYPIATVSGHWVEIPEKLTRQVIEGCECQYCVRKMGIVVRKPYPKPGTGCLRNPIAAEYGLDTELILVEAAANFYLLIEMGAMQQLGERADEIFRDVTIRLADQLCLYLELACLGEFRYAYEHSRVLTPWMEEGEGYVMTDKRKEEITNFAEEMWHEATALNVGIGKEGTRMAAWSLWRGYRDGEKYGDGIYQLLIDGFRGLRWGRVVTDQQISVGGPKWAVCIEAAEAYRKGLPAAVFVDMALSLRHNGNIAYNKFFDVGGLDAVIDWAFKGDTRSIQHYAIDEVRELWQGWRDEQEQKEQAKEQAKEGEGVEDVTA